MQGYHPEIVGVMSKDGETVTFEEVMKARLGVDHWVKCIGLHVRATLRYFYIMANISHKPITKRVFSLFGIGRCLVSFPIMI